MALSSTVRTFAIELSDIDRGVYESLELRVAQHPSETERYLVARILAFCFEYEERIAFTDGLSSTGVPAVEVCDLTGQRTLWVDVGAPDSERLHKARKSTDEVRVYCHKDPTGWLRGLKTSSVHASGSILLYGLPYKAVNALADTVVRRNKWSVSRIEGEVFVETEVGSVSFMIADLAWP